MAEDVDTTEALAETEEETPKEEKEEPSIEKVETPRGRDIKGLFINVRMLRRIVQILFLLGINAYVFTAWFGNEMALMFWASLRDVIPALPIIAPLEAPFAMLGGSFDIMHMELTAGIFPFFTLGVMIIILTVLGRAACGWVCPIGTIQDFATLPKRTKLRPAPGTEKELRRLKAYIFVIVTFFSAWVAVSTIFGTDDAIRNALGLFADSGFDPLNPAYILFKVTTEQTWPYSFETLWFISNWGWVFWLQIIFVGLIVVVSFWVPRWFCRWLCPAGWFYSVFSRDALIGIGRNPAKCTPDTCNTCEVVCPMNIRIRKFPYQHMHSSDCIMCLECKSHCPNGAIVIRFS